LYSSADARNAPGPFDPPATITIPFGNIVAVNSSRGLLMLPVGLNGDAAVTVNVVTPVTGASCADMVVEPAAIAVAEPTALIVATGGADELQVTALVTFCVLPSL
jgi:hypothetical protein